MKTLGVAAVVALALATAGCSSKPVAAADDAVKACRSSDSAPSVEALSSVSANFPDGRWIATPSTLANASTALMNAEARYTLTQRLHVDFASHRPATVWTCTAGMAADGNWTVDWTPDTGTLKMPLWSITSKELQTLAPPRDLSGPGHFTSP